MDGRDINSDFSQRDGFDYSYDYSDDPLSSPTRPNNAMGRKGSADKFKSQLITEGESISPVELSGNKVAETFWGKSWVDNLEQFHDYERRLPLGKQYIKAGCVVHLEITPGLIYAKVAGSSLYDVHIRIAKLEDEHWNSIIKKCSGEIPTLLDLLSGKLSTAIIRTLTAKESGIFPMPSEIKMSCSCIDDVSVCKHIAAALYGVGHRLDSTPDLFFTLRSVNQIDLVVKTANEVTTDAANATESLNAESVEELSNIFGIDIDIS